MLSKWNVSKVYLYKQFPSYLRTGRIETVMPQGTRSQSTLLKWTLSTVGDSLTIPLKFLSPSDFIDLISSNKYIAVNILIVVCNLSILAMYFKCHFFLVPFLYYPFILYSTLKHYKILVHSCFNVHSSVWFLKNLC